MPANVRGVCLSRGQWSGGVRLQSASGTTTYTPQPGETAWSAMKAATDAAIANGHLTTVTYVITTAGEISITASPTFELSFTGGCELEFGFTNSAYATSTVHRSEAAPPGAEVPYDRDGLWYTLDAPHIETRPMRSEGQALQATTPSSAWRTPPVEMAVLRDEIWAWLELAAEQIEHGPARVTVCYGEASAAATLIDFELDQFRVRSDGDAHDWLTVTLGVARYG